MAKALSMFQITIRGNKNDGPTEAFVQYEIQDSVDTELRKTKSKKLASPSFNKTLHNSDGAGEFWHDELAQVETDESIS